MNDDPTETLTTIEAKVLCLRYGIEDIDKNSSISTLRTHTSNHIDPNHTVRDIAQLLGKDDETVKDSEISALRKLKVST